MDRRAQLSGAQFHARDAHRRRRPLLSLELRSAGCRRHRRGRRDRVSRSDTVRQEERLLRCREQARGAALVARRRQVQAQAEARDSAFGAQGSQRARRLRAARARQSPFGFAGVEAAVGFHPRSRMTEPSMTTTMTQDEQKRLAARAALRYLDGARIVGVGTGSTVKHFIDALAERKDQIDGTVSSSEQSTRQPVAHGIRVLDLNDVDEIAVYVDGADECDGSKCLIKGGGGALTREKIIAAVAKKFVCIIDAGKRVDVLGKFPLPIEVIPMARSYVAREIVRRGGKPVWRENV